MQRFLMVAEQTQTKYLTMYQLKERGWTATMIATLLPAHNAWRAAYIRVPSNAPLHLRARIEEVELSDEFLIAQEKSRKPRLGGARPPVRPPLALVKRCVQKFRPT